ncbi:P-loop ATPase, Sll1717 family [Pseudomonas fragariae (ex Marin et al. 2024)]|uniref:P-loop ATPase, Sll1717 family n=1 Tax=Pseudomonas fragariae (ex Marin et al. 2024) TaxID=3080056 RepID=UPI003F790430
MTAAASAVRTNPLGDTTAENDERMLSSAFIETPDFRALVESDDRTVVVGRRGTGKSALFINLRRHWIKDKKVITLTFSPDDTEIIGFRSLLRPFSNSFVLSRAATKMLWRYAMSMEIASYISGHYKLSHLVSKEPKLKEHVDRWNDSHAPFLTKCRRIAKAFLSVESPEEAIGDLPFNLDLSMIEDLVLKILQKADRRVVILMDRLDEGYEPDAIGIGIIAGLAYAAVELNQKSHLIRPIIFLRDNVFRALAKEDPDYSRNLEGQVIRLHWDWALLLQLAATRMKLSFKLDIEKDQRIWDRCTAGELQGRDGFKRCLQFTLYRPRDLLSLLNESFFCSFRHGRDTAVLEDLEYAAKSISVARLEDLWKEYQKIFPPIQTVTSAFKNAEPEISVMAAMAKIDHAIELLEDSDDQASLAEARLLGPTGLLQSLYSIGFIGLHDQNLSSYTFCHDGRTPDKGFESADRILVHPCYWLGLNLSRNALAPDEAEEINDEYDIKVDSLNPKIRNTKIGQIVAQLDKIPLGREGERDFELWSLEALKVIFAAHLVGLQLHPNGAAVQRRDITGTNRGKSDFWSRVLLDYKSRNIVFDAKNFQELGPDEYRQLQSYLTGSYGKLGFIINRDESENLTSGKDLDWTREMHGSHQCLIVKLPAKFISRLLQKLRSPEKHDVVDRQMWNLLTTYETNYLGLKSTRARKKSASTKRA